MLGLALVLGLALLLGLRHATDPDHVAAVTTLAGDGRRGAARLGFTWGLGHATSLLALGVPALTAGAALPRHAEAGAEAAIGIVIAALAVRLLVRCRRGLLAHTHARRRPLQAYGIGLLHGTGGSAGVCVLLVGTVAGHGAALAALPVFAAGTAVSMAALSAGFGAALARPQAQRTFARVAPVFACASLAFGVWYALGALTLVPYVL
jgi:hypothetical protein